MTTSHDTSRPDTSADNAVPTVSFSHSRPDDQVDYDQLNAAGAPGTDELHPPFTPPPAHLAPTDPPAPREASQRQPRRGGGGSQRDGNGARRGGNSRNRSSSRAPRRRH